jgi:hypothetical protein
MEQRPVEPTAEEPDHHHEEAVLALAAAKRATQTAAVIGWKSTAGDKTPDSAPSRDEG